jgi:hypothetical protein
MANRQQQFNWRVIFLPRISDLDDKIKYFFSEIFLFPTSRTVRANIKISSQAKSLICVVLFCIVLTQTARLVLIGLNKKLSLFL